MAHAQAANGGYHRYHIETKTAPDIAPWPSRFKVRVGKVGLATKLVSEMIHTRFDMPVVTSRPCMYGVYSGPVGGFAPREHLCVGCLRCTTENHDFVSILPNPERRSLGDSYFNFRHVDAVAYEAESGRVPVKGAGYRGQFGGEGWDGMWTDMSEIVRPTRDGIHGREFISTVVDIGVKANYLLFDETGQPVGRTPHMFTTPLPFFYDLPPQAAASSLLHQILIQAAESLKTLVVLPLDAILYSNLRSPAIVPLFSPADLGRVGLLPFKPRLVQMAGWDAALLAEIRHKLPQALVCLRTPFIAGAELLGYADAGVSIFHFTADYHGRSPDGRFVFDLIRAAHKTFVEVGRREEVTLLGSGGMVAAEHTPKAIIAGLDLVGLDTAPLVAMQARFTGEFRNFTDDGVRLPGNLNLEWGVQRLKNLAAAWRDQLLEILGAMGLREVRRLRGEIGRAMFQKDLERDAFAGIEGYHVG